MTTQDILDKIARYKSAMEAETDDDTKKKFKARIEALEKDIEKVEAVVEKAEEKLEKKEDKAMEEAMKKLQRYKDAVESETDPDTIAKFKKRIEDIETQLKGVKEQIKEEKKEIEEQKKELKEAVSEVQSAQKSVRTQAIKKASKQASARKSIGARKKTRSKKIADIIGKLDKLIDKNPALKAKYKGARGGSYMQYRSVDLKRDAGRASKPFGYRFKGDSTKVPKPSQRDQSNVYYEGRANRADVYPKRKIKLAKGGKTDAGRYKIMQDTEGKFEQGFYCVIDTRDNKLINLFQFKKEAQGYLNEIKEKGVSGADASKYNGQMADGGMMSDGGKAPLKSTYKIKVKPRHEKELSQAFIDMKIIKDLEFIEVDEDGYENYQADLTKAQFEEVKKLPIVYENVMSKGGNLKRHRMFTGGVVLNVYDRGSDWKINQPTAQREFETFAAAKKAGEKSEAFQYEIIDDVTGDVMFTTHSEKMTPSLTYKKGGKTKKTEAKSEVKEKKKSGRKKHHFSWKPSAKGNVPDSALSKKEISNALWRYYEKKYPEHIEKK